MMKRAAAVMKGTVHEDDCMFYHNALSLMASKEYISWMKSTQYDDRTIFQQWLLPICGCNEKKDTKIKLW